MSTDAAIQVSGLSKRYDIGADHGGYRLLTETIADRVRSLGRRPKTQEFWALRDVDFEVPAGMTFGIIGHNGAGKSTLLKILSRITPPTQGNVRLRGRIAALLEVGTGFHPELTGRENIFLNGAILGMRRAEIQRKFDEIVEFADVGRFVDTPVKRYSSGMQLRLGFSVAAHLDPEILIVDEVLAVGDLAFQQKCLARMESVAEEGRTVLMVSHNLTSVRSLCERAILLWDGRVKASGTAAEVIDAYVQDVLADSTLDLREREHRAGTGELLFTDIRVERDGRVIDSPSSGDDFEVVANYETRDGKPIKGVNFAVSITDQESGERLLNLYTDTAGVLFDQVPPNGEVRCRILRCPLPAGQYLLGLWADVGGHALDSVPRAADLTVAMGDFYGSGRQPPATHRTVMVDQEWSLEPLEERKAVPPASPEDGPSDLSADERSEQPAQQGVHR